MAAKKNKTEALLDLITLDDAAKLRGVTRPAISYLIAHKRIRSMRLFNRILVYRDDVLTYKSLKGGRPATKKTNRKK
jgi:excisionase family DNA binding protein